MLRASLSIFLFVFLSFHLLGQCDETIRVSSQAELDQTNPCPVMKIVDIEGDVTDLSILADVLQIEDFSAIGCSELTEIYLPNVEAQFLIVSGCSNLESIEVSEGQAGYCIGVSISDNPKLEEFVGLSNCEFLVDLTFDNCPKLELPSLSSLEWLQFLSISNMNVAKFDFDELLPVLDLLEDLYINNCNELTEISSWGSISTLIRGDIRDNPILELIPPVDMFQIPNGNELTIENNPSLNECCGLVTPDGVYANNVFLYYNGPECYYQEDVFEDCFCNGFVFTSQAEIDNINPACLTGELFNGELVFRGPDIVDLSPVTLIGIFGNIVVEDCPILETAYIGGSETQLDSLIIRNNQILKTVEFGPDFGLAFNKVIIENNPLLENFKNELFLSDPPCISVVNNPLLNECCFLGEYSLENTNNIVVENNGPSCNDFLAVRDTCYCRNFARLTTQAEIDSIFLCPEMDILDLSSYQDETLNLEKFNSISKLVLDNAPELISLNLRNSATDTVIITSNPSLESVALRRNKDVLVENNPSLKELSGSMDVDFSSAIFRNNPLLRYCCVLDAVDEELFDRIVLEDNDDDCNDVTQIAWLCECLPFTRLSTQGELNAFPFCRDLILTIENGIDPSAELVLPDIENLTLIVDDFVGKSIDLSAVDNIESISVTGSSIESIIINKQTVTLESLVLKENPNFKGIEGVDNLEILDVLELNRNPAMTSMPDFITDTVMTSIVIHDMSFSQFSGFNDVEKVDLLTISDNEFLVSMDGFHEVREIIELNIEDHPRLSSVDGFDVLTDRVMNRLRLVSNPSITDCCFLSQLGKRTYSVSIANNGFSCNSFDEILDSCPCTAGDIIVTSQSQLDTLTLCDSIFGNIMIVGDEVQSLEALERVEYIEGNLSIENTSISIIDDVNPVIQGRLSFVNNDLLVEVMGFEGSISSLTISENEVLEIVEGLSLVSPKTVNDVVVTQNPLLNTCCFLKEMNDEFYQQGFVVASDNGTDCNSFQEVLTTCSYCQFSQPLSTQDEVDGLMNCDSILGNLVIAGSNIRNVNAARNLKKITGSLYVEFCPDLDFLSGFIDVVVSDSIVIRGNTSLRQITQFHNPVKHLLIRDNSSLTTVNGFSNYRVNKSRLQSLELKNNPVLNQCCFIQNYPESFYESGIVSIDQNGIVCSSFIQASSQDCDCDFNITRIDDQYELNSLNPCPNMNSDITITGPDITDLSNLEDVKIYQGITLDDCDNVESLEAFKGLQDADHFEVLGCDGLSTINDFYSGSSSFEYLTIENNARLEEVVLQNSNVDFGAVNILSNPQLETFTSYGNGTLSWDDLTMTNNPLLTECCIALINLSDEISDNGIGCSSSSEISANCDSTAMTVRYFFDENVNGIKDDTETYLQVPQAIATSDPVPLYNYVLNDELHYFVFVDGVYELVPSLDGFMLTNDPDELRLVVDENAVLPQLDLGIIPDGNVKEVELNIIATQVERCRREVPFKMKVTNLGSIEVDGSLLVEIPDEFILMDVSHPVIDSSSESILIDIASLSLFESDSIYLTFGMPNENYTGEVFCLPASFVEDDTVVETSDHCFVLRCAYDPNDKHGTPFRGGEDNYTLFEEDLAYTIRFENLGNDTAFDIRVEDQLSHLLNWNTFRLVSASHDVTRYEINNSGLLNVYFNNILLPSKEQDTIANKGYFHYTIEPLDELDEFSIVENTAGIFFDFNAPVITNTTKHTYVSEIPTVATKDKRPGSRILKIYPNPTKDVIYIHAESDIEVELLSMMSSAIAKLKLKRGINKIELDDYPSGIYLLKSQFGKNAYVDRFVISR